MEDDKTDEDNDLVVPSARVETVADTQDTDTKLDAEAGESKKRLFTVLGVGVVIIVVLGGIVFALSGGSDESAANESARAETDSQAESEPEELQLEDIQTQAETGSVVWNHELETFLSEYDTSNENVTYAFTDANFSVTGNGLPSHKTGTFPNENNPNSIAAQDVSFTIVRTPKYLGDPTDARVFGYSLGGVKIEPGTAERDPETGAPIEAFNVSRIFDPGVDDNNAHVQPNGTYHYHGIPEVLITTGEAHSNLIGFAVDGFPIYGDHGYRDPLNPDSPTDHMTSSWRLKTGERPSGEPEGVYTGDYTTDFEYVADSGDLDQCNGRFTVTPEFPNGTYAYFVTETFPFFGRCVMGEVLDSFANQQLLDQPQQRPQPPR